MGRSFLRLALVALASVALAGCGPRPGAGPGGGAVTLRYGSPYPPSHPFSQADIAWIRHVEALSKGRLRIQPFWGGSLISSDDATLELAHGVADIALVTPIYSRAGMRAIKTQAGFYAGAATPAEQIAVYACLQQRFPVLDDEMRGVRVLAIQGGNLPNILTRSRPVTRLADLRGLRIRAPAEEAALLRRLGADPVTMPMAEVYSSLSKGVIDGVVAPADTLKSLHFSEVAPHFSGFTFPRGAYPARAISLKAWARLPNDLKTILIQSRGYWEDQLTARVVRAEAAGYAFGRTHGERFAEPAPEQQAALLRLYDAASLGQARAESTPAFDGVAMFEAAHAAVARLRAGRPPC